MKIIRDENNPIMMIPLLCDWNINRCYVKDCKEKPNTIIAEIKDVPVFGLCEKHYQEGNKEGGCKLNLVFENKQATIKDDEIKNTLRLADDPRDPDNVF